MSVIITLEADIKKDKMSDLIIMLEEFLPKTRMYDGFINFSLKIQKSSNHVLFYEEWENVENYEAYLAWRGKTGVMDRLGEVFESSPTIRYYDTKEI